MSSGTTTIYDVVEFVSLRSTEGPFDIEGLADTVGKSVGFFVGFLVRVETVGPIVGFCV